MLNLKYNSSLRCQETKKDFLKNSQKLRKIQMSGSSFSSNYNFHSGQVQQSLTKYMISQVPIFLQLSAAMQKEALYYNPSYHLTNWMTTTSYLKFAKRVMNYQRKVWYLLLDLTRSRTAKSRWVALWIKYQLANRTVSVKINLRYNLLYVLRVSNRSIYTTKMKILKCSNMNMLFLKTIRFYPFMWLTM